MRTAFILNNERPCGAQPEKIKTHISFNCENDKIYINLYMNGGFGFWGS